MNDNTSSVAPSGERGVTKERPQWRMEHPPRFVTKVKPNDVLMGRGSPVVQHVGNIPWREEIIAPHTKEYGSTNCQQAKCDIARQIVNEAKERGGRYLCKIKSSLDAMHLGVLEGTDAYPIATDDAAIEKIKQTLRSKDPQDEREADTTRLSRCSAVREDMNLLAAQAHDVFSNETSHRAVRSSTNTTLTLLKEKHARQRIALALQHREEQKRLTSLLLGQELGQHQILSINHAHGVTHATANLSRLRSGIAMNLPPNIAMSRLQNGRDIHLEASLLQRPSMNRGTTRLPEVVDQRCVQGDPLLVPTTLANQAEMRHPTGTVNEEHTATSSRKKVKRLNVEATTTG